jgi:putative thioredoxin
MKHDLHNFNEQVINASHEKPVVVEFYADWCGPCKIMRPVLEELAENSTDWDLVMINVEKEPSIAAEYSVYSIPNVQMFRNGEAVASMVGSKPKYIIQNWLDRNMEDLEKEELEHIDKALRLGKFTEVKEGLLNELIRENPKSAIARLLQVIELGGRKNPEARQWLESFVPDKRLAKIVKRVRDMLDIDEDEHDKSTPTSSPVTPRSKNADDKIDVRFLDRDLLSQLILMGVNEVRSRYGVSRLMPERILTAAAVDHNLYQVRNDLLTHHQNNPAKHSVQDRVKSFGGRYNLLAENVQYKAFPIRTWNGRKEWITGSYVDVANEIVNNWVKSPGHFNNIIAKDYKSAGTAVGWNPENNAIFATQVFGA